MFLSDSFCNYLSFLLSVLTYLLSNAAKYGAAKDTVDVCVEDNGDRYKVSVINHGPGIPKEFHSRVFSKFAQADASNARKAKGWVCMLLSLLSNIMVVVWVLPPKPAKAVLFISNSPKWHEKHKDSTKHHSDTTTPRQKAIRPLIWLAASLGSG